ncbi:hypothetical protein N7490_005830 [Penicillium lividum]|nr:hypothetical protein N7490_005830 [Penicillium lividum]
MIINLLALFNILLNIFTRDLLPLSALRVVAISLPSGSSLLYGCAAIMIYLEYGSAGDPQAEDGTPLLSDEEMQRRQLARLLEDRPAPTPSPDIVHSTFRLEIPTLEPVQKTWTREESLSASWYPNSKSQWTSVSQSII